jgi:hypothetical protein
MARLARRASFGTYQIRDPVTRKSGTAALRPGNVHSADGWDGVLKPVVTQGKVSRIYFRASGTAITPAPAIIHCSCSISLVIWNAASLAFGRTPPVDCL